MGDPVAVVIADSLAAAKDAAEQVSVDWDVLPSVTGTEKAAAKGEPVANRDLWQRLIELSNRHRISWHWVKGHAGDPGNERADALANRGAAQA